MKTDPKSTAIKILTTTLEKIQEEHIGVKNCPKCGAKGLGGNVPVGHPNGMDTIWLRVACCSKPDCEFCEPNYQDYDKWQEMERENE